ncbi:type II toxin-antitoxin system HicB family antitoxin [Dyella acidiphila]|uniref:Type II toxin-antitoxin system HicB family antitoxin n=1 Tax=Dyella acidiphila TaxID=2775866 RepID=A0ABR9GEV6_9GAMM|nr:type II toxin-antitoxin system HicB family antitoxin [Dyella acidiphila]MBE1162582.1 type II toxin-antitoxin system HicB family antitoxin [Dyella acidiphila]
MRFPVVLHTDDGQHYGVTVPDLPGCFSAGDSIDDALVQVLEAIDLHLEGIMDDDSAELPEPQPIRVHQQHIDYANGIWAVVDVDTAKYEGKAEKINITVPRKLLSKIDSYVSTHPGETRSGFMTRAALQAIRSQAA